MNESVEKRLDPPLSDEVRLKRICQLLCTAMLREEISRAMAPAPVAPPDGPPSTKPDHLEATEAHRVASYLAVIREASPGTIRTALGLSRWSFHTALHRLLASAQVVASGRSRALKYRLNGPAPADLLAHRAPADPSRN